MDAKQLQAAVRAQSQLMRNVNKFIYTHPELGYEELDCAAYLVETLTELGLVIERPLADIETAFRAILPGDSESPQVGLVLLYDAVPTIAADGSYSPNHSCGHNVISGAVVGAVAALATLTPRPGSVVVMGLPADEIGTPQVASKGGSKALTVTAGVWDNLDAVLYAHPELFTTVSHASRWMTRYRISLSHARRLSQQGELSGSVVGAVQELLQSIRALEARYRHEGMLVKGVWLDGDIEESCTVHAQLQVLVFGHTKDEVQTRTTELQAAVNAVSATAEIPVTLEPLGEPYMGVRPNHALTEVVQQAMTLAGLDVVVEPPPLPFATDFGNISQRIPGALIGVGHEGGWRFHTAQGAAEFGTLDADHNMFGIADVLALTIMRLFEDPPLITRISAEHNAPISN